MSDRADQERASGPVVVLDREECLEMLAIANEMIGFCSGHMPKERYYAVSPAIWVLINRVHGRNDKANQLIEQLRQARQIYFGAGDEAARAS